MSATIQLPNGVRCRLVEGVWTSPNREAEGAARSTGKAWRDSVLCPSALGDTEVVEAREVARRLGGKIVDLKPTPPPANVYSVVY